MKHVPNVLASEAKGRTLSGADGQFYESKFNSKTKRWRWVKLAEARNNKPTTPPVHHPEQKEERKRKVHRKAGQSQKLISESGLEAYRAWRLKASPTFADLPGLLPEEEAHLRAHGIPHLDYLIAEVFKTESRDDFLLAMEKFGLDKQKATLIYDKYVGQRAVDEVKMLEASEVEESLFEALSKDKDFSQFYALRKAEKPAPGLTFGVAEGGMAVVFKGTRKIDGMPVIAKVEYSTSVAEREVGLMQRIDPTAKHINFPLDLFHLPMYRTKLNFHATASVYRYLNSCDAFLDFASNQTEVCLSQCAEALEEIHRARIVHCDVSAGNFCLDVNGATRVYLIDFGLARLIKRQIAGSKHKEAEFFGTPRYAPLAAHTLQKQGFRDDLESLAYVFYTPITGKSLPWSGLDSNKDKAKIVSMKRQVPPEIRSFVLKCRKLRLDEMPVDYQEFVAALIE